MLEDSNDENINTENETVKNLLTIFVTNLRTISRQQLDNCYDFSSSIFHAFSKKGCKKCKKRLDDCNEIFKSPILYILKKYPDMVLNSDAKNITLPVLSWLSYRDSMRPFSPLKSYSLDDRNGSELTLANIMETATLVKSEFNKMILDTCFEHSLVYEKPLLPAIDIEKLENLGQEVG